jgi:hypothetical protein
MEPASILLFQSVFLVALFVSMAFRMKGNYLVHGIIMIVAVAIGWVATLMNIPSFFDSNFLQPYMSPSSTFAAFSLHSILGVATLVAGTWLIALWRPRSTDFAVKSTRVWQSTVILWLLAYVVGVWLFFALGATFFG